MHAASKDIPSLPKTTVVIKNNNFFYTAHTQFSTIQKYICRKIIAKVYPKINILSSFTYPYGTPDVYYYIYLAEHKLFFTGNEQEIVDPKSI